MGFISQSVACSTNSTDLERAKTIKNARYSADSCGAGSAPTEAARPLWLTYSSSKSKNRWQSSSGF